MMKKASLFSALALSSSLLVAQTQTKQLTTNASAPIGDNQDWMTAGPNGGVLLQDIGTIEKLQAFDRERIPELIGLLVLREQSFLCLVDAFAVSLVRLAAVGNVAIANFLRGRS